MPKADENWEYDMRCNADSDNTFEVHTYDMQSCETGKERRNRLEDNSSPTGRVSVVNLAVVLSFDSAFVLLELLVGVETGRRVTA